MNQFRSTLLLVEDDKAIRTPLSPINLNQLHDDVMLAREDAAEPDDEPPLTTRYAHREISKVLSGLFLANHHADGTRGILRKMKLRMPLEEEQHPTIEDLEGWRHSHLAR